MLLSDIKLDGGIKIVGLLALHLRHSCTIDSMNVPVELHGRRFESKVASYAPSHASGGGGLIYL